MKNTPLQKLIDEAENTLYGSQLRWLRAKATELLESEKHMVVDAYNDGVADSDNDYYNEQYFKETYEQ